MRHVNAHGLPSNPFNFSQNGLVSEVRYVLSSPHQFGYGGSDLRGLVRLALEACDGDDEVVYDLTALAVDGYFEADEDLFGYAEYLIDREKLDSRIVVLTEGSTDKCFLERSLTILYPHLAPYFSFMDFEGTKMPGGASVLGQLVRAFAGAGIANRVLALFDNDTAGNVAVDGLSRINLPANLRVRQLPTSSLAENYPTIGPTGLSKMDVNGLACSIELFLGEDVLRNDDGTLAAIQWTGFEPKLRQYQGEITNKNEIQERFRKKLSACERNREVSKKQDWGAMRDIISVMRNAFSEADGEAHLEHERAVALAG
jgi:hypothetical protein